MGKLFYGTQSGMTEDVARGIRKALPELVSEIHWIDRVRPSDLDGEDFLILGGSTWGDGELTDDWVKFWPHMDHINFAGRKVAIFSVGDSYTYGRNFCSAMRELHDKLVERGAVIVGQGGPVEDYDFEYSAAVEDGRFIGLAVDDMNECEKTDDRIAAWAATVRAALALEEAVA